MNLYFYYVDEDYIDYLKQYEINTRGFTCVPNICYGKTQKFIFGAVLNINGTNYFVPVSSYSKKQEDVILMKDKKNTHILGSLRFTYMIPVPVECLSKVDINSFSSMKTKGHISEELAFCRRNRDKIFRRTEKTYKRVILKNNELLTKNSCDFLLLEKAYNEYIHKKNNTDI